jgi:hypothetical protein
MKKGMHRTLHPHTFTEESTVAMLEKYGFKINKKHMAEEPNDEGEYFLMIAAQKTKE